MKLVPVTIVGNLLEMTQTNDIVCCLKQENCLIYKYFSLSLYFNIYKDFMIMKVEHEETRIVRESDYSLTVANFNM